MFRTSLVIALTILTVSLVTLAPAATQAADYSAPGFYLAVGGGVSFDTELEDSVRLLDPTATVGSSGVVGLRGGVRPHPHVAVEFDLEYLIGSDIVVPSLPLALDLEAITMTSNIRLYLLTGRFQPYALAGMGFMNGRASASGLISGSGSTTAFAMRFGGGLESYVTEHIFVDVGVAYLLPFGTLDGFDYVSVRGAVGYKF